MQHDVAVGGLGWLMITRRNPADIVRLNVHVPRGVAVALRLGVFCPEADKMKGKLRHDRKHAFLYEPRQSRK